MLVKSNMSHPLSRFRFRNFWASKTQVLEDKWLNMKRKRPSTIIFANFPASSSTSSTWIRAATTCYQTLYGWGIAIGGSLGSVRCMQRWLMELGAAGQGRLPKISRLAAFKVNKHLRKVPLFSKFFKINIKWVSGLRWYRRGRGSWRMPALIKK